MVKRVLITGKNSYVGTSLEKWLSRRTGSYTVDSADMHGEAWESLPFQGYDAVFHVAGIVHQPGAPEELHIKVNRDLAAAAAGKAKREGVAQFILMSTMAVYGFRDVAGQANEIGEGTLPRPYTYYGKAKWEAETCIARMQDDDFSVCIIRAPMVYGANCPGNYSRLRQVTLRFGVVPALENERSMLFIEHLCEYARLLIDGGCRGVYCPQDSEVFRTAAVMEWIAMANGRAVKKSRLLGRGVQLLSPVFPALNKAFGNLTYAPALSVIPCAAYCGRSLREAIRETEAGWGAEVIGL